MTWDPRRVGGVTTPHQVVEVLADLSDDPGERGPQQLLDVVRPGAVAVVRLQVVDPLTRAAHRQTDGQTDGWTDGQIDR